LIQTKKGFYKKARNFISEAARFFLAGQSKVYCSNCAVTLPVTGFTVKRTSLMALTVPPPVEPPPEVCVPAFAFGEPFGNSWSLTILKVVGPLAKPRTRKT
jgi:hypothetical protein